MKAVARASTVALVTLLLIGCTISRQRVQSLSGTAHAQSCSIHHVPLLTVIGYRAAPGMCLLYAYTSRRLRMMERCPHAVPERSSLVHDETFTISTKITYCPTCEERLNGH
jgi:hypothetical protein